MKTFEPEKVRQFFFIVVLSVLGLVLFTYLKSFLPSFLGAITFYVLMRKYVKKMIENKWSPAAAALLLMLVSFLIILLPVFIFVNTVSSKIGYVINHATEITGTLVLFLKNIETRIGYHFLNEDTNSNYRILYSNISFLYYPDMMINMANGYKSNCRYSYSVITCFANRI